MCAAGGTHAALWAVWVRSAGVELASGEHPRGALRAADGRQQPWLWQGSRRQAALGRWLAWIAAVTARSSHLEVLHSSLLSEGNSSGIRLLRNGHVLAYCPGKLEL